MRVTRQPSPPVPNDDLCAANAGVLAVANGTRHMDLIVYNHAMFGADIVECNVSVRLPSTVGSGACSPLRAFLSPSVRCAHSLTPSIHPGSLYCRGKSTCEQTVRDGRREGGLNSRIDDSGSSFRNVNFGLQICGKSHRNAHAHAHLIYVLRS